MNELKQGTQAWLELRKQYVTATDAPIIMGLSPFKTPYKLWRQKMDLDPPDEETERMREGTRLEPLARKWIEKNLDLKCEPKIVFKNFMMASLDGVTDMGNIFEIKCGPKSFEQAKQGIIADYYICQMQHQMVCADVQTCAYVAFDGKDGILIYVKRDQNFINEMIPKLKEFYECLLQYNPPTMTTKDYQMRSDPSWNHLAESYRNAYLDTKRAELLEESLKQELILSSGGQSSMGSGIKLSKIPRKGSIDYSVIPQLQGLDLEPYRKKGIEYWKIGVD